VIDLELIIRMLVVGYVFALRSERLICREVQVDLRVAAQRRAKACVKFELGKRLICYNKYNK
jgi:hypothetical protein